MLFSVGLVEGKVDDGVDDAKGPAEEVQGDVKLWIMLGLGI